MSYSDLIHYKDIKKEIKHIEEQLARLEIRVSSPRTPILTDMPAGPHNTSQFEDDVIKLIELKEKYKNLLSDLYGRQLAVEESIKDLDPIERDLIRCRYFNGDKWEQVQKKIGYAQKQTHRIHNQAIEKLKKWKKI